MPARGRFGPSQTTALWILAILGTLFFLRAARAFLIPIAMAVLISYALEPAVAFLVRQRVPRVAAAALVLLMTLGGIAAGGYALKDDVARTAQAVPKVIERARAMTNEKLGTPASANTSASGGEQAVGTSGESGARGEGLMQRAAGAIFTLAGNVVVVLFLTLFVLVSGHLVRDRLVEVAGSERRQLVSRIIDDINGQIQRYLLVLLFTGAVVGAATWLMLAWLGVEHAAMWGLLAGVFNSIPYFGPVIVSGGSLLSASRRAAA